MLPKGARKAAPPPGELTDELRGGRPVLQRRLDRMAPPLKLSHKTSAPSGTGAFAGIPMGISERT